MKRKRVRHICCGMLTVLSLICSVATRAEEIPFDGESVKAALLMEGSSMQIILDEDGSSAYNVAGLSRLAALLVICEAIDAGNLQEQDIVTITETAAAVSGPTAFLEANENIATKELLKSAIMISAGDSIMALAQKLSGTEQAFLQTMNGRMKELGVNVEYTTLSSTEVMLTAMDLAKLGVALAACDSFLKYSSLYLDGIDHEDGRYTELVNPNRLVKNYPGCYGIATGSSSEAGYCGIFAVRRADHHMICVIIGAPNSAERFSAAQALLDYGLTNYQSLSLAKAGEVKAAGIPVINGTLGSADLIAKTDISLLLPKSFETPMEIPDIPEKLNAPFAAGDTLGKIDYLDSNGKILATLELTVATGADEARFGDYLRGVFLEWLHQ